MHTPHEVFEALLTGRLSALGVSREVFLAPEYDTHTHDPFTLPDMGKAVERIERAIIQKEKIAIYADFDADGIPGAALMDSFFKKIGVPIEVYIPHRHKEGYGFHPEAVALLAGKGVTLIITVDVGSVSYDGISRAREEGVDVIVTDHHELGEVVPEAYAVVNPKRDTIYPFRDLCGTAVAFKLVQALVHTAQHTGAPWGAAISVGWEKWLLDLVAIATVSDMVPLVGENRVLVKYGLTVLRKSPRLGIRALCKKRRLQQSHITEEDIGFSIAPRINAASRMDQPEIAFQLLTTNDPEHADALVQQLEKLNAQRKGAVAHVVKEAREKVNTRYAGMSVAVAGDPLWKPALLGLAANSVLSGRGGVVCLWGKDGNGCIKGSCRSDGSIHVVRMFERAGITLIESGGHACAGGFSVSVDDVHHLQEVFTSAAHPENSTPSDPRPVHTISIGLLSLQLQSLLNDLAPFGVGNEKPLFEVVAHVDSLRVFGKEQNHTEFFLVDPVTRARIRAFEFFKTPDTFAYTPRPGECVRVQGTLERALFGGSGCALRVHDVLPPLV